MSLAIMVVAHLGHGLWPMCLWLMFVADMVEAPGNMQFMSIQ